MAFQGNEIEQLIIPNSVKKIDKETFMNNKIIDLGLGESLTVIKY